MSRSKAHFDPWILDEETWDAPDRLTDADLFAQAGEWRRGPGAPDDPEDYQ
ncbi:MAG: hypothetical protein ACK4VY_12600 [Brevundimonas sp.]